MIHHKNEWNPNILGEINLTKNQVSKLGKFLIVFILFFKIAFNHPSHKKHISLFCKGILSDVERKNLEYIALNFADQKEVRNLQHFFQKGKLDDELLLAILISRIATLLSTPNGMITIDESCIAKKGKDSIGVARQYNGRLGKVDNCQVGVHMGYTSLIGYALLNSTLYLPERWFTEEYKERREKTGAP